MTSTVRPANPSAFMISGTASGTGKTTVTLAILAALRRRGLTVQPFKGGPDYLDTGHHTRIAQRASRNLDTWMLSEAANVEVLRTQAEGADVLVVEGMMGLFDGKKGDSEKGSSAEIAKLLRLPVLLVVDAGKTARSIAAVVLGFELFDPELPLAGIILNRVASERHLQMLRTAIEARCRTPVLGWLPRQPAITITERHLGLQSVEEQSDTQVRREALADLAEAHLDLDKILRLQCALDLSPASRQVSRGRNSAAAPPVRIGVARDPAFTFYYEDNFDLLRSLGAELVPFSPLADDTLPAGLDALYLGGGYPELHGPALSGNQAMLSAVHRFAACGRPVYAECGGMMYLSQSLTTRDGVAYEMTGVLPFSVEMTARLVRFGYATVKFTGDCILGPAGTVIRGHSFHYSRDVDTSRVPTRYDVQYSLSGEHQAEGFSNAAGNVLASYTHLHFRANPSVAEHFLEAIRAAKPGLLVSQ